MDRRAVLRFLIAALMSLVPATSAISLAQETVVMETTEPPGILSTWECTWTVNCTNFQGMPSTGTGTEYAATADRAARKAENAAMNYYNSNCTSTPPCSVNVEKPVQTSDFAFSENDGLTNSCKSACQSTGGGEWVVYYACTTSTGVLVSKESSGRTYCEALADARASVCRMINSQIFGRACRCCSRVVERPACSQYCVPRKRR